MEHLRVYSRAFFAGWPPLSHESVLAYDDTRCHMNCNDSTSCMPLTDPPNSYSLQLLKYNFGPYYMHMINTFYLNSNNFSRILLDGYIGPKVNMERGIKQGIPFPGICLTW